MFSSPLYLSFSFLTSILKVWLFIIRTRSLDKPTAIAVSCRVCPCSLMRNTSVRFLDNSPSARYMWDINSRSLANSSGVTVSRGSSISGQCLSSHFFEFASSFVLYLYHFCGALIGCPCVHIMFITTQPPSSQQPPSAPDRSRTSPDAHTPDTTYDAGTALSSWPTGS